MLRNLICIMLCMFLALAGCSNTAVENQDTPASPPPSVTPPSTPTPAPTPSPTPHPVPALFFNNEYIPDSAPIVYNSIQYVPIIKAVQCILPDASIDQNDECIVIETKDLSATINLWQDYVIANGRYLYNPNGVLFQESAYYLPTSLISAVLGIKTQNDDAGNVFFLSGGDPLIPGDTFYDADALFWLSHIINAESGNQPLRGKIAIGNVVLNRVKHPSFPDSIYDVLFQTGQFYDTYAGAITKEPNNESIIAAKLCLDGAVVLPNAYWFNGVGIPCWASSNKTLIAVIGDHAFYG